MTDNSLIKTAHEYLEKIREYHLSEIRALASRDYTKFMQLRSLNVNLMMSFSEEAHNQAMRQAFESGYLSGAGKKEVYSNDANELIELVKGLTIGDYITPVRNWLEQYDDRVQDRIQPLISCLAAWVTDEVDDGRLAEVFLEYVNKIAKEQKK